MIVLMKSGKPLLITFQSLLLGDQTFAINSLKTLKSKMMVRLNSIFLEFADIMADKDGHFYPIDTLNSEIIA